MIVAKDFNLKLSWESGQPLTFHADYSTEGNSESLKYAGTRGTINLSCTKTNGESRISYKYKGYDKESARAEVIRRFDLLEDMHGIYERINTDPFMDKAINALRGMRVTRNDPWESTLCFITSQFNNIKRIRGIIKRLIQRFGEDVDGSKLFPTAESIAKAEIEDLRACGMGFRAKYIKSTAESVLYNYDLDSIYNMKYNDAKELLMELEGVGDKVADCILLFGYHKLEAFPIDVWVKRVIERAYFNGRKKSIKEIHRFAGERWQGLEGYAQQYIFEFGRRNKII